MLLLPAGVGADGPMGLCLLRPQEPLCVQRRAGRYHCVQDQGPAPALTQRRQHCCGHISHVGPETGWHHPSAGEAEPGP